MDWTYSRTAPAWVLSMRCSPSRTGGSRVVPSGGHRSLLAKPLQCGLLSPQVHLSCQEPAPAQGPQGVTVSFRHPPAPARGPPWAAGGDLLHGGPPWTAGELPLWHQEHLLPLLIQWPWCLQSCFSHIFSLLSPSLKCCYSQFFFPFLITLSRRHCHCCWLAHSWPVVCPSWSRLALAPPDIGEVSSSFLQKPPLYPSPQYPNLAMQTQYCRWSISFKTIAKFQFIFESFDS